jgi:hypothetical protein
MNTGPSSKHDYHTTLWADHYAAVHQDKPRGAENGTGLSYPLLGSLYQESSSRDYQEDPRNEGAYFFNHESAPHVNDSALVAQGGDENLHGRAINSSGDCEAVEHASTAMNEDSGRFESADVEREVAFLMASRVTSSAAEQS